MVSSLLTECLCVSVGVCVRSADGRMCVIYLESCTWTCSPVRPYLDRHDRWAHAPTSPVCFVASMQPRGPVTIYQYIGLHAPQSLPTSQSPPPSRVPHYTLIPVHIVPLRNVSQFLSSVHLPPLPRPYANHFCLIHPFATASAQTLHLSSLHAHSGPPHSASQLRAST